QKSITQLDIQSLAPGIYFLKIQMLNGNIEVRKFVKE
ncbi:MAG: T9SS C-terminal target domain-containing protein, partial [Sphingobacteriales bacterium]